MKTQRAVAQSISLALLVTAACSCANRAASGAQGSAGPGGQQAAGATMTGGQGVTGSGAAGGANGAVGASSTIGGMGGAASSTAGAPSSTGAGGTEVVLTTGGMGGNPVVETMSCANQTLNDPYAPGYQIDPSAVQQAEAALNAMSPEDKANQMRGTDPASGSNYDDIFRSPDDSNNGVKGFLFRDGPRGVNLDAPYVDTSGNYIAATATAFPVSMARGAAFDMDLEYRIGVAIGDETLASRNTMQLAPTVNVLRHPAWGRAQETYGEDPFHVGRLGMAFTVGVQQFVPACVKHFMGNNVENQRENFNAIMDAQTMREIYGRAYQMITQEAGVACVMAAYNRVGTAESNPKSAESAELLTQILRNEWGFQGMVLTDWWAMDGGQSFPGNDETGLNGISAGLDMELPWSLHYQNLTALVDQGRITEADLNAAARRILEQKFRFNVAAMSGQRGLRAPTTSFNNSGITGNDAHIELAYEAAKKGMVLLKNDNGTLPITGASTVAVLGLDVAFQGRTEAGVPGGMINFATGVITGDSGSSRVLHDRSREVSPANGIQSAGGVSVVTGSSASEAANADFVVVVVGRTPDDEGEEYTGAAEPSGNFYLDGGNVSGPQNTLVAEAAALGKPMAVVMIGGSVIDMPWLDSVPAVVMAWYPGMVGGRALGELLFGQGNFSGKLPFTWPASWNDEPTFTNGSSVSMPYDHGYRHFDRNGITPLFPFGHGLSYTTVSYEQVQLGCTDVTTGGVVPVHVDLQNTGSAAVEETIFVFTSYAASTRATQNPAPAKELKAFQRVQLDPGVAKRVTLQLKIDDLRYWDTQSNSFQVETGTLNISVGPNAGNLPLTASLPVI